MKIRKFRILAKITQHVKTSQTRIIAKCRACLLRGTLCTALADVLSKQRREVRARADVRPASLEVLEPRIERIALEHPLAIWRAIRRRRTVTCNARRLVAVRAVRCVTVERLARHLAQAL